MAWVLVHHCGRRADDGRDALAYAAALRDTALHRMFVLACEAGRYARARIPEFPDALKENPPRDGVDVSPPQHREPTGSRRGCRRVRAVRGVATGERSGLWRASRAGSALT